MKRSVLISILSILLALLCSCTPAGVPSETSAFPVTEPQPETTLPETEAQTEAPLQLTVSYDDYLTEIDGVLPTDEGVAVIEGSAIEIIDVNTVKYFHAKDIGTATVKLGEKTAVVTVEKAKLNLIVIMGQSNSGNHFDNATSDIKCALGTAYWWGGGYGIKAKEPQNFIGATKGFHSTLLAEL